jgi:hypothetical protein
MWLYPFKERQNQQTTIGFVTSAKLQVREMGQKRASYQQVKM